MNYLHNKEIVVDGNWFKPLEIIKSYKSVIKADYINQMSSTGDWDGYIIVKNGNKYGLLWFGQENRAFAGRGFDLYVGDIVAEFDNIPEESMIFYIYDNLIKF